MAGTLDNFLNLALQQKQAAADSVAKRQAAGAAATEKAAALRAKVERQATEMWEGVKTQIDTQIDAINEKSAVLELIAVAEDRFVAGPILASRAIHFSRRTGLGKISLYIQVGRVGTIQYRFDNKMIFAGRIAQLKAKDHETIMAKIVAFVVAHMQTASGPKKPAEGSRAQIWGISKTS